MWEDILLNVAVEPEVLRRAVAQVLGCPMAQVRHLDAGSLTLAVGRAVDGAVLLETTPTEGDFALRVTVYIRDETLLARLRSRAATSEAVTHLASLLEVRCLIADDELDPYRWVLITPEGAVQVVRLDAAEFERDRVVLVPRQVRSAA